MAVEWTRQSGLTELGTLGGFSLRESYASHISGDGRVIVGGTTTDANMSVTSPFKRTALGGMVQLPPIVSGSEWGFAWDCNSDGSYVCGNVGNQPVLWTPQGVVDLTFTRYGWARGVSQDGRVVVGEYDTAIGVQGFRWVKGQGLVVLPKVPGALEYVFPWDNSADGSRTVGQACISSQNPNDFVPVYWDGVSVPVRLGTLYGSRNGNAWSVTSNGQSIVGGIGGTAFIWDAFNGVRDLNVVLRNQYGIDLTGWHLIEATQINANGTAICGNGYHNGAQEGWVFRARKTPILSNPR